MAGDVYDIRFRPYVGQIYLFLLKLEEGLREII